MVSLRSPHLHAGLWIGTVTVLMMVPSEVLPELVFWPQSLEQWIDKIQHVVVFFIMVLLLTRSLKRRGGIKKPVLVAALLTLGISFGLEALQALVPWRYSDVRDLAADLVGVVLAVIIVGVSDR